MAILSWIVFGLIVGAIARFLMPGRQSMGILMTIVLGVVGSFFGGLLSSLFYEHTPPVIHPTGWIGSILGALILLFGYSWLSRP
jgi:uncharacterized membrane protein YeaQ/YmgE (transglycosylase-associated protein family)